MWEFNDILYKKKVVGGVLKLAASQENLLVVS
jgi:hypothetical protein